MVEWQEKVGEGSVEELSMKIFRKVYNCFNTEPNLLLLDVH